MLVTRSFHASRSPSGKRVSSLAMFATTMAMIFLVEATVMLVLPLLTTSETPRVILLLIDASLLVAVLCPGVWILVFRPVQALAQERGDLLRQQTSVVERERTRVAHELHDELGQIQTAILLTAKSGAQSADINLLHDRLLSIQELASSAITATRRLARGLSPEVLEQFGLGIAIPRLAEEWNSTGGVDVRVECTLGRERFDAEVELCVYRVIQEATVNALKHAQASVVTITVTWSGETLSFSVTDDGPGFIQSDDDAGFTSGMGVRGMRQRVELLGGTIAFESRKGSGTRVAGRLPAEIFQRE